MSIKMFFKPLQAYQQLNIDLTAYLLVLSADNLCKQLSPSSKAQQNIQPGLDPKCLTH